MSYHKSLDEYTTFELEQELKNREQLRNDGKCDYCGRLPTEPTCKFPARHITELNGFKVSEFVRLTNRGDQLFTIKYFVPNNLYPVCLGWGMNDQYHGYANFESLIKVDMRTKPFKSIGSLDDAQR